MLNDHSRKLSEVRTQASGWHFAKESLTSEEHQMLYVIEDLLREIDMLNEHIHGRHYASVWPSDHIKSREQALEEAELNLDLGPDHQL